MQPTSVQGRQVTAINSKHPAPGRRAGQVAGERTTAGGHVVGPGPRTISRLMRTPAQGSCRASAPLRRPVAGQLLAIGVLLAATCNEGASGSWSSWCSFISVASAQLLSPRGQMSKAGKVWLMLLVCRLFCRNLSASVTYLFPYSRQCIPDDVFTACLIEEGLMNII